MSTIKANNVATLAGVTSPMSDVVNGSARAWVNFNGTGTVAIRAAYNVSSITDNGVGRYVVNMTSPIVDANYIANVCGARVTGNTGAQFMESELVTRSASAFEVITTNQGATLIDTPIVSVSVFR